MPVNCGALPQTLIESLLFGHERGTFTGAHERQVGSIEAAHHGTIFLDEIGDLPRSAQASQLRFLKESTVMRVGSTREIRIDARVIAATHMDLRLSHHMAVHLDDALDRKIGNEVAQVDAPAKAVEDGIRHRWP